ncbi:type II toxin-antitoxin system VapC family toxin [Sandaracinobacteroides saxicola]|uniref:Ribonuclease VapC n=1 Tax=Sandaracinobacteroides saxicola TaxID=2759707 RepID=A0A7G5IKX1_9SPHN|nr:PIN domain nuclease [Sandaracinobacteroides saxicola]QMW24013.1 PIN domain nuclease [Sandaracinobacteroides saxicola]
MIVADASVWIDYLRGVDTAEVGRLRPLMHRDGLAICDLTLTEVLQGIRSLGGRQRYLATVRRFPLISTVGRLVAVQSAEHYNQLRARGITVRKTIDCLIATRCILDGHALLFSDRDFQPFVEHLGLRSAMS